ncbi:MAG: peptide ABC transporter substrate-binding protein [Oscillospiraceae bacterium]|nr:peptide ABC transporter substrate-binding protein [Oscillospiraceae bacterium]
MKKGKFLMALFLAGTLTLSLTSCGNSAGNTTGTTTAAPTTTSAAGETTTAAPNTTAAPAASAQTISILSTEPKTLDGVLATDVYAANVNTNILTGLTRLTVDSKGVETPTEDGAEKIDVSADGLVWTFHLRQSVKWTDGVTVKAQDYFYTLMRALDPNTASQYAFLAYPIKGAEEYNTCDPKDTAKLDAAKANVGVKVIDDSTLEITLKGPCAYFRQILNNALFEPQRQDFVEKCGATFGADADKVLACGPYKVKSWTHNDNLVLEKNPDYWDAASYPLQTVTLRAISDMNTYLAEFEAGGLDYLTSVNKPEWYTKFQARTDMTNVKSKLADVSYLLFNEDAKHNSIMKNLKIRQAVSAAINREEAVQELYGGLTAVPAYDWCSSSFNLEPNLNFRTIAGPEPVKTLKDKITDPKATLIEGMQELGLGTDPSQLEIKYYTSSGANQFPEYFQANLQDVLGCKITLDISEWAQFQAKVSSYEHDIAAQAWNPDYNDPMTMFDLFMTGTEQSGTGMANAAYDDLIKQAGSLPAEQNEQRIKLFSQAENILLVDECAVAPWAHRQRNGFIYNYVKGYQPVVFGSLNLRGLSIQK